MKKSSPLIIGILSILILSNCVNTRFRGSRSCPLPLTSDDKVLVMNLPFYGDLAPLEPMRKKFADRGIEAKYILEEEWNLKAAGIGNPADTLYSENLIKMGYKYLLFVKGVEKQSSGIYSRSFKSKLDNSPNQLYDAAAIEEATSKAKLYFELFSIEQKRVIFATTTETDISPITIPTKNGDRTNINFSSDKSATEIAMKKTAKRLLKLCR